ncbi:MAG: hypothetical protein ACXACC_02770 [Promethearchaeota archaeon]|jgi:hypothetical protein
MFLEKLKEFPKNLYVLIIKIIGFLIFILTTTLVFASINQMVPPPYGVLDFEFAWVPEQVLIIFASWGPSGMAAEALVTYWDFLYIVGYGSFIFGAILLVTRRLEGKLQKIGLWMTLTPIVAGIFDIIENINLLVMLDTAPTFSSFVPFIASLAALIKFGVLILGIAFFFVALVIVIIKLIRKRD